MEINYKSTSTDISEGKQPYFVKRLLSELQW